MKYKDCPIEIRNMIDRIIRIEGGYSDDPLDSGGATKYGITEAVARKHGWKDDMKWLPIELAQDIYATDYWYEPNFHLIHVHSKYIAEELFEAGVNSGVRRPSLWLQELLNVLNDREKYYKDILEDSYIGEKTAGALQEYLKARGWKGHKVMYNLLNCKQGAFYVDLASARIKDEKYIFGWALNRLDFLT